MNSHLGRTGSLSFKEPQVVPSGYEPIYNGEVHDNENELRNAEIVPPKSRKKHRNKAQLAVDTNSSPSIIYVPCVNGETKRRCMIKMNKNDNQSPSEKERMNRDFDITRLLMQILPTNYRQYILEAYDLIKTKNGSIAIVKEDFPRTTLHQYVQDLPNQHLSLTNFFQLAIILVDVINQIHEHRVLLLDIQPQNIFIDTASKKIKLSNFGAARIISNKEPFVKNDEGRAFGSLHYMSPEQTGRLQSVIDSRSDIYSLGVLFYYLLAGRLPFEGDSPTKLIHSHFAKQAPTLSKLNRQVPHEVSSVIKKMMAKSSSDRYRSLRGVKKDLEYCRDNYSRIQRSINTEESPHSPSAWKPGQSDATDFFALANELFGREKELAILREVMQRVYSTALPEIVLIGGDSGIGKSILVNELRRTSEIDIVFITGRYDQIDHCAPYHAISTAIGSLVNHVLGLPKAKLKELKKQLREELGENAKYLIGIVPQSELIVRKKRRTSQIPLIEQSYSNGIEKVSSEVFEETKLETVSSEEVSHCLYEAVATFLKVVISSVFPSSLLIMFIDDLQWANVDSIHLIERVVENIHNLRIMLVAAYRDNEVDDSHPIQFMIQKLTTREQFKVRDEGIPVITRVWRMNGIEGESRAMLTMIKLKPLKLEDLNKLVAATAQTDPKVTEELSKLIMTKTDGNPFFTREFLISLYRQELLWFDYDHERWTWNLDAIRGMQFSDNVVAFMIQNFSKSSQTLRSILPLAACIGNTFTLENLSLLYGKSEEETRLDLLEAIREGWIMKRSEGNEYYFLHDGLRQCSYLLLSEEKRVQAHYFLGKMLLAKAKEGARGMPNIGRLRQASVLSTEYNENESNWGLDFADDNFLFDIVNHLNKGSRTITRQEYIELIELNIMAARKALDSCASGLGVHYASNAKKLLKRLHEIETLELPVTPSTPLSPSGDETYLHKLGFCVSITLSWALCYSKNYQQAITCLKEIIVDAKRCRDSHVSPQEGDMFIVYMLQCYYYLIHIYSSQNEYDQASDYCLEALKIVPQDLTDGITPEDNDKMNRWIEEHLSKIESLITKNIDHITELPKLKSTVAWHLLACLIEGSGALLLSNHEKTLFFAIALLIGQIIFTRGLSEWASRGGLALFGYAYQMLTNYENFSISYKLCKAGCDLALSLASKALSLFFMASQVQFTGTIYQQIQMYEECFLCSIKSGETAWANYAALYTVSLSVIMGMNLNEVMAMYTKAIDYILKSGGALNMTYLYDLLQVVQAMRGESEEYVHGSHYPISEENLMNTKFARLSHSFHKAHMHYFLGQHETALRHIRIAERYRSDVKNFHLEIYMPILHAFIVCAVLDTLPQDRQKSQHKSSENRDDLLLEFKKSFDEVAHFNTKSKLYLKAPYKLLQAELMAQERQVQMRVVINKFMEAIQCAKDTNFPMVIALAYTRLASYVHSLNMGSVMLQAYVREAGNCWEEIGASGMANRVREKYLNALIEQEIANDLTMRKGAVFQITRKYLQDTFYYKNQRSLSSLPSATGTDFMNKRQDNASVTSKRRFSLSQINDLDITELFIRMMPVILDNTSAERCLLVLKKSEDENSFDTSNSTEFNTVAECTIGSHKATLVDAPLTSDLSASMLCVPIVNRVLRSRKAVVIDNANEVRDYHNIPYVRQYNVKSILCAPIIISSDGDFSNLEKFPTDMISLTDGSRSQVQRFQKQNVLMGVIYLEHNTSEGVFREDNRAAILRTIIDVSVENAKSFCSLSASYARFLPKQFLKQLGKRSITHVVAGDTIERTMSVLFTDIRDFLSITENMSAQKRFQFINHFLEFIVPVIDENDGFIDKFLGDKVMALFASSTRSVTNALNSAVAMIDIMNEFNKSLEKFIGDDEEDEDDLMNREEVDHMMGLEEEEEEEAVGDEEEEEMYEEYNCQLGINEEEELDSTEEIGSPEDGGTFTDRNSVSIGVGIHYGNLMLGTVGYEARLDATVISDTVNIASRLKALTKTLGASIIVSSSVIEQYEIEQLQVQNEPHLEYAIQTPPASRNESPFTVSTQNALDTFTFGTGHSKHSPEQKQLGSRQIRYRHLGSFILKGKNVPYELYDVYDLRWRLENESEEDYQHKMDQLHTGLELFSNKETLADALKHFAHLSAKHPRETIFSFYHKTCQLYSSLKLPKDWRGEIRTDKTGQILGWT